jgi:7-carboxy-7-deazaguanine synthase
MSESLVVREIYLSVQGESTFAGLPCVFVRLAGCNLRCSYCDTAYAFTGGQRRSVAETLAAVDALARPYGAPGPGARLPLVELTGGEPLLQAAALTLMRGLGDAGYTVLLETSGALGIGGVDPRVHRIMDLKCPSSGEVEANRWSNLAELRVTDEIKFVVGTVEDYAWMRKMIARHDLARICPLLVSWASPLEGHQQDPSLKPVPRGQTRLERRELAERILADGLPVRFQLQLHKVLWPPDQRGV